MTRTPVKPKPSPYSRKILFCMEDSDWFLIEEHKLSEEKIHKDDSYEYNPGKHLKPNTRNLRGVDSTQDIIFEEHSTFHISKDNIDSPRNRKFSQAQEYLSSKSAQNTDRARDHDGDVSNNFDYSQNTGKLMSEFLKY